jgi:hypothetical protein
LACCTQLLASRLLIYNIVMIVMLVGGSFALAGANKPWLLSNGINPTSGGYSCSWSECCDGTHNNTVTCWRGDVLYTQWQCSFQPHKLIKELLKRCECVTVPEADRARKLAVAFGFLSLLTSLLWLRISWRFSVVPPFLPADAVPRRQAFNFVCTLLVATVTCTCHSHGSGFWGRACHDSKAIQVAFLGFLCETVCIGIAAVGNLSDSHLKTPESQSVVSSPHASNAGLFLLIGWVIAVCTGTLCNDNA